MRLSPRSKYDFSLPAVTEGQESGLYVSDWHAGETMSHADQERWILARIVLSG